MITTREEYEKGLDGRGLALYMHWYGELKWVKNILYYCKLQGFDSPDKNFLLGLSHLCQVMCNFCYGGQAVGITTVDSIMLDNRTYIIGEDWTIEGVDICGEIVPLPNQEEYIDYDYLTMIDRKQALRMMKFLPTNLEVKIKKG